MEDAIGDSHAASKVSPGLPEPSGTQKRRERGWARERLKDSFPPPPSPLPPATPRIDMAPVLSSCQSSTLSSSQQSAAERGERGAQWETASGRQSMHGSRRPLIAEAPCVLATVRDTTLAAADKQTSPMGRARRPRAAPIGRGECARGQPAISHGGLLKATMRACL